MVNATGHPAGQEAGQAGQAGHQGPDIQPDTEQVYLPLQSRGEVTPMSGMDGPRTFPALAVRDGDRVLRVIGWEPYVRKTDGVESVLLTISHQCVKCGCDMESKSGSTIYLENVRKKCFTCLPAKVLK